MLSDQDLNTDLVHHIFNNADAFLEEKAGIPLTFDSYNRFPNPRDAGVI